MSTNPFRAACALAGCSQPAVQYGRCAAHAVHRRTTHHHRLYRRARWRRVRQDVLVAHPFCADCRDALAEEIHHRIPAHLLDEEQFHNPAVLAPLCRPCHSTRTRRGE